jgi:hypothetical protein
LGKCKAAGAGHSSKRDHAGKHTHEKVSIGLN